MNKPQIILLCAIPGSGKTTFREQFIKNNPSYIVLCADVMRGVIGQSESDQEVNYPVFQTLNRMEEYFCKLGVSMVIDETHYKKKYRRFSIELAKKYHYEVIAVTFDTDLATCLVRNEGRDRKVPLHIIHKMFDQYEAPTIEEGFNWVVNSEDFPQIGDFKAQKELERIFGGKSEEVIQSETRMWADDVMCGVPPDGTDEWKAKLGQ